MGRDEFTCCRCSRLDTELNVHHFYYNKGSKVWEYPDNALVTLCKKCHEELHAEMEFFSLITTSLYNNFVFGGIQPSEVAELISSCD